VRVEVRVLCRSVGGGVSVVELRIALCRWSCGGDEPVVPSEMKCCGSAAMPAARSA
jgi:hypothetical protein